MSGRILWKIAAPMIGLGALLLVLGVFAAYNVHEQQRTSSEQVVHQVHSMLALHELHMAMREIRYQTNMFLRLGEPQHLETVERLHNTADRLLAQAKVLAQSSREHDLIHGVELGYRRFFDEFQPVSADIAASGGAKATEEQSRTLTKLSDDVLTNQVLRPLENCLVDNRRVVEQANQASQSTASHLKIGFTLLGICGAVAGLLLGTVVARTIGRSIVQLNVTVRGVAGRLADVTGPVSFSHTGDLAGLDQGLRSLENDISDVVERLQQRETELLRSEQLANVGQLAAGVAHELRNPLMPMKMLVQAALERGDSAGLSGRSLHVLNEEIGRLEESIQSFLDYARPPVPEMSRVDLRELVRGTVDLVVGRARKQGVSVVATLPEEAAPVLADRGQIRQLLLNLLLNALDSLPDGGVIECIVEENVGEHSRQLVGATSHAMDSPDRDMFSEHDALRAISKDVLLGRRTAQRWVALHVADNGAGIPPESLQTIFEPFVTTKDTGTGLGLSICRRIALAHGGSLLAENRPSGGAEFTLLLPATQG